jgi:hypothetical protein
MHTFSTTQNEQPSLKHLWHINPADMGEIRKIFVYFYKVSQQLGAATKKTCRSRFFLEGGPL